MTVSAQDVDDAVPQKLVPWADPAYTQRHYVKVFAPGLAGDMDIARDGDFAAVYLPLRVTPADKPGHEPQVEPVLLLDANGEPQPVLTRLETGTKDVVVAFPTRPGMRRFCLYSGSADGATLQKVSTRNFRPSALSVRLLARRVPGLRIGKDHPVRRAEFEKVSINSGVLDRENVEGIDHPEPPAGLLKRYNKQYLALYEGLLRAPVSGEYGFAVTTRGVACLIIDGIEVLNAAHVDNDRKPFSLNGKHYLTAGMHRVVLHYARGDSDGGVRLHWQPPFARDYMRIPSQAFPRALPAVVYRFETAGAAAQDFIHAEMLGHVRTTHHRGGARRHERVLVYVDAATVRPGDRTEKQLTVRPDGASELRVPASGGCFWATAGRPIEIFLPGQDTPARTLRYPTEAEGGRDVLDLTGELELKAAPHFLYPGETGHVHLETRFSPLPFITPKERIDRGPPLPTPMPYGRYRMTLRLEHAGASGSEFKDTDLEVTPRTDSGRRKVRVPLEVDALAQAAESGEARLVLSLTIGDLPIEAFHFRLLHARKPWPGTVKARHDGLDFAPAREGTSSKTNPEEVLDRALIVVPREQEADYRRFQPPGTRTLLRPQSKDVLFLGDPLVEAPPDTPAHAAIGLASKLKKARPALDIQPACLPGPHKGWYVFRLLETVEQLRSTGGEQKIPERVLVSLGGGDAGRQTPLFEFERGLDVLIDRLRQSGVRQIVLLGVVPEPGRARQGEGFRDRTVDLARRHHLDFIDVFSMWTKEQDWMKRFLIDPESSAPAYGPVPRAAALDDLLEALTDKLD